MLFWNKVLLLVLDVLVRIGVIDVYRPMQSKLLSLMNETHFTRITKVPKIWKNAPPARIWKRTTNLNHLRNCSPPRHSYREFWRQLLTEKTNQWVQQFSWQIYCIRPIGLIKKWSILSVRLSSYGCTREVGSTREKRLSGTRLLKPSASLAFPVLS